MNKNKAWNRFIKQFSKNMVTWDFYPIDYLHNFSKSETAEIKQIAQQLMKSKRSDKEIDKSIKRMTHNMLEQIYYDATEKERCFIEEEEYENKLKSQKLAAAKRKIEQLQQAKMLDSIKTKLSKEELSLLGL